MTYLDFWGYYFPAVIGILSFLFGLALLLSSIDKYLGHGGVE